MQMDKVFLEEQKNLKKIECIIKDEAMAFGNKAESIKNTIDTFSAVDYADRQRLAAYCSQHQELREREKEYLSYQDEPYFGRMDIDCDDNLKTETYFIGKKGISVNHSPIVVDWRSQLGQYFYMKSEKTFHINNYVYSLALRRALVIQSAELINYNTEYDVTNVSLEGEVIDPFLLTVLRDKRRQNRLTDIIKTIQSNQNEIIRKPQNENFIVQGCAGSGKTMILLHRLSYLIFNNRDIALRNIKIITPNREFDMHIDDLSKELGLEKIERFSVDEYYARIIRGYSDKINIEKRISSEKDLKSELLKKVYSEQYMNDSIRNYHAYWEDIWDQLMENRFEEFCQLFSIQIPDYSAHKYESYLALSQTVRKILSNVDENDRKRASFKTELETANQKEEGLLNEVNRARKKAEEVSQNVVDLMRKEYADSLVVYSKCREELDREGQKYEALKLEHKDVSRKILESKTKIKSLQTDASLYCDYDVLVRKIDDISKFLKNAVKTLINQIEAKTDEYKSIPLILITRRRLVNEEIKNMKQIFSEHVASILSQLENDETQKLIKYEGEMSSLEGEIARLRDDLGKAEKYSDELHQKNNATKRVVELLEIDALSDLQTSLDKNEYNLLQSILKEYNSARIYFVSCEREYMRNSNLRSKSRQELELLASFNLSGEQRIELNTCISLIEDLKLSKISRNVMLKDLRKVYSEHKQAYKKDNYRHKLYLKMLFCYLYFTRHNISDTFLNIDEAQDLALVEYKLLFQVLGKSTTYNLYGDTKQLVYTYKGVEDWQTITSLREFNVCSLNENYRNTLQITEYCNKEFSSDVFPIGVTGSEVEERELLDAINWILEKKRNHQSFRCAIIMRHGRKKVNDALHELLEGQNVSWFSVSDDNLSVLSVESAKGLEFEVVVSIVDGMTENEKYISFTRALESLCVVRQIFGENEEEISEETDDDSIDVMESDNIEDQEITVDSLVDIDDDQFNETKQRNYNIVEISDKAKYALSILQDLFVEKFNSEIELTDYQKTIMEYLVQNKNILFCAPSGSKKSMLLILWASIIHKETKKQVVITAEQHLQENELVLVEKLGFKAGYIDDAIDVFDGDFKKEKYDIIFVPYSFFRSTDKVSEFIDYFVDKIAYWGIDHISEEKDLWLTIKQCGDMIGSKFYLMNKMNEALDGIEDFESVIINNSPAIISKRYSFSVENQKDEWIVENNDLLWGQGIIYCDTSECCKRVSKILRKKKIIAPEYSENLNVELINYLTNSFSTGSVPILVSTQEFGKNLSNANIRFICHFDVPQNPKIYQLHMDQISNVSNQPEAYDLLLVGENIKNEGVDKNAEGVMEKDIYLLGSEKNKTNQSIERRERDWDREEVVILVTEYFRTKKFEVEAIEDNYRIVSGFLRNRELQLIKKPISDTFRNYSGIRMQSNRVRCIDPDTKYSGMEGTKLQKQVVAEYLDNPERILNEAKMIWDKYK